MPSRFGDWPRLVTAGLVIVLAGIAIVWGIYLLTIGVTWVGVGNRNGFEFSFQEQVPDARGWIPVGSGLLTILGIVVDRPAVAWIGAAVAAFFAFIHFISIGGVLIPVVLALVPFLGLYHLLGRVRTIEHKS